MQLEVNPSQRYAKMRAHTATHLLHAELGKIFPDTKQAGSLVDSDLLRFDFYAERLLHSDELLRIEQHINQMIAYACEVKIEEMTLEKASQLGAKMFFEEKYGDIVRIVQVLNTSLHSEKSEFSDYGTIISMEFCGGTHVTNTKEIGAFTILSQEAVASGIKRITALTGPRVSEKLENQYMLLTSLMQSLEVKSYTQLPEKVNKLIKDIVEMKSQVENMEKQLIHSFLISGEKKSNADFDIIMKVPEYLNFKMLGNEAKQFFTGKNILLATTTGNFLLYTQSGISAKALAQKLTLKGGGNDQQIQGKDSNITHFL